jgi:hypothetical protein
LVKIKEMERTWEKPAFHIRRAWNRAEVVQLGSSLTTDARADVRRLVPILREMNSE